jgi:outer membrane protein OmpA-like peptidoglycan-associated protein
MLPTIKARHSIMALTPATRKASRLPAFWAAIPSGDYKLVMTGETRKGLPIRKESTLHLVRQDEAPTKGLRYSILYDFDSSNSTNAYDKFLTDVVAASIADGSTVIIHGHTDIIGEDEHNMQLSKDRAQTTCSAYPGSAP